MTAKLSAALTHDQEQLIRDGLVRVWVDAAGRVHAERDGRRAEGRTPRQAIEAL